MQICIDKWLFIIFKSEKIIYIKNGNNIVNFLFGIKIEKQRDIFAHSIPNKKVSNNCKIKNMLLLLISWLILHKYWISEIFISWFK